MTEFQFLFGYCHQSATLRLIDKAFSVSNNLVHVGETLLVFLLRTLELGGGLPAKASQNTIPK